MKIITIGGPPAAGKTYTSKLIAKNNNYLAIEMEKLRWDFFNNNLEENMYKYTQHTPLLEHENMRDYYMRCTLYESIIPLEMMVEWHRKTMEYISEKTFSIIKEIESIKKEKDYLDFCDRNKKLINHNPEFEILNKEVIICSHAFINTISFSENERIRIDFDSDRQILIERFKHRENITTNEYDRKIEKYYNSYVKVLENSSAKVLDTSKKNVVEKIRDLI